MSKARLHFDPRFLARGGGPRVEIVLQDDGRRGGVEQRLAFPPVLSRSRQQRLGLLARQPFVLQHDGTVTARRSRAPARTTAV